MKPDYVRIGRNIRDERKKANMTQEALAEKAGLSVNHISHIEIGASPLSLPALVSICEALDTTADRILHDSLSQPTAYLRVDVNQCFEDTSPQEASVMLAAAAAIKNNLRGTMKEKDNMRY